MRRPVLRAVRNEVRSLLWVLAIVLITLITRGGSL